MQVTVTVRRVVFASGTPHAIVFSWEVDGDCVGGMTQEDETTAGERLYQSSVGRSSDWGKEDPPAGGRQ